MILVKGLQRYQSSKLEVKRNICQSTWFEPMPPGSAELADIFSELQLWPLVSLQPLNQNQCLVPHLTYLFHISPRLLNDFKEFNLGSKYPCFNRAYVVSSGFGCTHLYMAWLSTESNCYKSQYIVGTIGIFSYQQLLYVQCSASNAFLWPFLSFLFSATAIQGSIWED